MKIDFNEIQEGLSSKFECDNNLSSILSAMTVTRPPKRGYGEAKEYPVTSGVFKPWVILYIAKQEGIDPNSVADKVFAKIEAKRGVELTIEQKKAHFAQVGTVNANMEALGFSDLVVDLPKFKKTTSTKATMDDLDLDELF